MVATTSQSSRSNEKSLKEHGVRRGGGGERHQHRTARLTALSPPIPPKSRPEPPRSHTKVFPHNSYRPDSCPTRYLRPPALDSHFHLPIRRYAALSLGAQVGVRSDPPTLKAMEPRPPFPPTPRRYAGRWVERGMADALLRGSQRRHQPRERRARTPSRGGAIFGSLCPASGQMACLSSSYRVRERLFFTPHPRPG